MRAILRRTLVIIALFMLTLHVTATVFSIFGFLGERPTNLNVILPFRVVAVVAVVWALLLTRNGQLNSARRILLAVYLANIAIIAVRAFFGHGDTGDIQYFALTAAVAFAIQLSALLNRDFYPRLLYGGVAGAALFAVGFWSIARVEASGRTDIAAAVLIAFYLYVMVLVPSLIGARERTTLDTILFRMAYTDHIAGLPNMNRLNRDLTERLGEVHRTDAMYAVFAVGINRLGRINQQYGYTVGNEVVRHIADRLAMLGDRYTTYRGPGATFFLLPESDWAPERERHIIADLNTVFSKPIRAGESVVNTGGFVAGTLVPTDGRSARRVVINLHNALGRVSRKRPTFDRIEWFDTESFRRLERRFLIEDAVVPAINAGEFSIAVQPKFDARTGVLHGGEVLARWNASTLGVVSPGEFIGAIENAGAMVPFSRAILQQTEQLVRTVGRESVGGLVFAVNLNASSLSDPDMVAFIESIVPNVAPAKLEIELTEDVFLLLDEGIRSTLENLKSLGIAFALDDFGTGFSNLGYLQDLHVDTLKIDRRFIVPLPDDTNAAAIVRAIITMAHAFDIRVVAEGVETHAQVDFLQHLGCNVFQGYLFGRPMTLEEFKTVVNDATPRSNETPPVVDDTQSSVNNT